MASLEMITIPPKVAESQNNLTPENGRLKRWFGRTVTSCPSYTESIHLKVQLSLVGTGFLSSCCLFAGITLWGSPINEILKIALVSVGGAGVTASTMAFAVDTLLQNKQSTLRQRDEAV